MVETTVQMKEFAAAVLAGGDREDARSAAKALRAGEADAPFRVSALCMYVATICPERLVEVYDGLAEGWLGRKPDAPAISGTPRTGDVSDEMWDGIWAIVFDPDAGSDPADITVRTAALTGLLPEAFHERVAAMSRKYPGVESAAAGGLPPRFTLEQLAACPSGSLGGNLHSLVIDTGFDLEVLERDSLGLKELPAPLDYLNVRILQCHDIWHLVGGYETSSLHEVAISGFQMAQFGHQYSSMFLGIVLTKLAFTMPAEGTGFLLDTILTAYVHGRETPPLLGVEWESTWELPVADIRTKLGVAAYDSPYPADIIEQLRSA